MFIGYYQIHKIRSIESVFRFLLVEFCVALPQKNCFENSSKGTAYKFCIYRVQLVQIESNYLVKFSTSNESWGGLNILAPQTWFNNNGARGAVHMLSLLGKISKNRIK